MIVHKSVFQHHAAAQEKGRYALTCGLLTPRGFLTTDGRRLHVRYYVDENGQAIDPKLLASDGDNSAMVEDGRFDYVTGPGKLFPVNDPVVIDFLRTVKTTRRNPQSGLVAVTYQPAADGQEAGRFTLRNVATGATVTVSEVEGQFPDYRRILPAGRGVRVGLDADYIAAAASCAQGPIEAQAVCLEIHGDTMDKLRAGILDRDWKAVESAFQALRQIPDTGVYCYGKAGATLVMPIDLDGPEVTPQVAMHAHTVPAAFLSMINTAAMEADKAAAWEHAQEAQAKAKAKAEAATR